MSGPNKPFADIKDKTAVIMIDGTAIAHIDKTTVQALVTFITDRYRHNGLSIQDSILLDRFLGMIK